MADLDPPKSWVVVEAVALVVLAGLVEPVGLAGFAGFAESSAPAVPTALNHSVPPYLVAKVRHTVGAEPAQELAAHAVNPAVTWTPDVALDVTVGTAGDVP